MGHAAPGALTSGVTRVASGSQSKWHFPADQNESAVHHPSLTGPYEYHPSTSTTTLMLPA
jgi:hypothetical protein